MGPVILMGGEGAVGTEGVVGRRLGGGESGRWGGGEPIPLL